MGNNTEYYLTLLLYGGIGVMLISLAATNVISGEKGKAAAYAIGYILAVGTAAIFVINFFERPRILRMGHRAA